MVLMNKMLELMEEHFSEGDYVEGSKMLKTYYDTNNDDELVFLKNKISQLEEESIVRDELVAVLRDEYRKKKQIISIKDGVIEGLSEDRDKFMERYWEVSNKNKALVKLSNKLLHERKNKQNYKKKLILKIL